MEWGTQYEAEAITVYEFERNETVEPVGFIEHPTIADAGASPDGLIGSEGIIEVKCPNSATHIDTLLGANINENVSNECNGRWLARTASFAIG